jgi:glycosyltransferase involved in cell wall biosynthesis
MGSCAARNKALSLAQGDYIQWLDHDDLLDANKISEQLRASGDGKSTRVLYSGSFGRFYFREEKARVLPDSLWRDLSPLDYFLIKFSENTWLHPSTWLVSRSLTELAGPWLDVRSPDDDGEYFCRVVSFSEKIRFIAGARSYWRIGNYGSLSQNMSEGAMEARFKSISLCITYLRAMENSARTRRASLKFLQTWLIYMYPEHHGIIEKMSALAKELGGSLSPPELSWKYSLLRKIFGWETAKKMVFTLPKFKTTIYRNWDWLMYKLRSA